MQRQVEFEGQIAALAKAEEDAAEKERVLEESLASLSMRKAQMEEELKAFETARCEAGVSAFGGVSNEKQKEDRVERAEAAFDRALSGVGGKMGMDRTDMENAAKL